MSAITMVEARAHLSRWVDAIVRGDEREIVIARHGRPAARLVAIDAHDDEVARLFFGSGA